MAIIKKTKTIVAPEPLELEDGYKLVIDHKAMFDYEDAHSEPFSKLLGDLQTGSMVSLAKFVHLSMKRYHPESTVEEAQKICLEYPDIFEPLGSMVGSIVQDVQGKK